MHFRINLTKTIQAAAELFRHEPNKQMSKLRLLKLLYIADRETLNETGRPMTWDTWVAMKHGPVLSQFYDVIKGENVASAEFDQYFEQQGHQILLVGNPGRNLLSRFEVRKLHELWNRYRDRDEWDIVEETHTFEEWRKNEAGNTSRPIPLEDVLEALAMPKDRIRSIVDDLESAKKLRSVFHQAH